MIKSLVEYEQAVQDGLIIQRLDGDEWVTLEEGFYTRGQLKGGFALSCIRIKPSITYYRVYLDTRDNREQVLSSKTPFEKSPKDFFQESNFVEWIFDHEVEEQPVKPDNETITLYECADCDPCDNWWVDNCTAHNRTGRFGTLVIEEGE